MLVCFLKYTYLCVVMPLFQQGLIALVPPPCRRRKRKVFAVDEDVPELEENIFEVGRDLEWITLYLKCVLPAFVLFTLWVWAGLEDISLYFPIHILRRDENEYTNFFELSSFQFFVGALLLDLKEFYYIARHVVCVFPFWLPHVEADLRPSVNSLKINNLSVSMLDIKDVCRFSEKWLHLFYLFYHRRRHDYPV